MPFALHGSSSLPCIETQDDAHVHWPSACLARPMVTESARKSFWVRHCQLTFFSHFLADLVLQQQSSLNDDEEELTDFV